MIMTDYNPSDKIEIHESMLIINKQIHKGEGKFFLTVEWQLKSLMDTRTCGGTSDEVQDIYGPTDLKYLLTRYSL